MTLRAIVGLALVAATLLALVVLPRDASAHALLVRSDPAVDARLIEPPTEVTATFSEGLDRGLSTMSVLDGNGEDVDSNEVTFFDDDPARMTVAIDGELPPGFYVVVWETLSSVDGHFIKGSFPITVLNPDGSQPSGPVPEVGGVSSGGEPTIDATIGKLGVLAGAAGLLGALAFVTIVSGGAAASAPREWRDRILEAGRRHAFRVAWPAVALLALAGVIQLAAQARQLGGLDLIDRVLADTDWGERWIQRQLVLGGIVVALAAVHYRRRAPEATTRVLLWAALLATLGYLFLVSLVSHAGAVDGSFWAVGSDFVHYAAAALWIGMLVQLALNVVWARREVPEGVRTPMLAAHLRRFSVLAAGSVVVLMATGVFNALTQVTSWDGMVDTPYGRALTAKLALIGLLLPVAGFNAVFLRPRVIRKAASSGREGVERLRRILVRTVWLEAALALGVLVIVAVLTQYPTTRVVEQSEAFVRESVEAVIGFEETSQAGDLGVNMSIAPNAVGTNSYQVFLFPGEGESLAEVLQVRLRFKPPDPTLGPSEVIAEEVNPNFFTATGSFFTSEGPWEVQVDVRRRDVDDVSAFFQVPVQGAAALSGPANDRFNFPLSTGSWSTVAAVGLIVAAALVWVPAQQWPVLHIRVARWFRMTGVTLVVVGLALLLGVHEHAGLTREEAREGNPVEATEASIARGRELFQANCTTCHGATGRGDGPLAATLYPPPVDFVVHVPYHADTFFFDFITRGFGDVMPAFGGQLSEEDRWNLVNFLRAEFSLEGQQR